MYFFFFVVVLGVVGKLITVFYSFDLCKYRI